MGDLPPAARLVNRGGRQAAMRYWDQSLPDNNLMALPGTSSALVAVPPTVPTTPVAVSPTEPTRPFATPEGSGSKLGLSIAP
jgi:hypothetical protein